MSLRRKIHDGSVAGRGSGYPGRGNSFDSKIKANELLTTKRTKRRFEKIESELNEHNEEENHERYLLTYADLITLLLGLFIILYAVSNVDAAKYEKLMENVGGYFGNTNFIKADQNNEYVDLSDNNTTLKNELQKYIDEFEFSQNIKLMNNERGIIISIMDNILFESGKADLSERAGPILEKLTQLLKTLKNDIRIEGHTDNVPINTDEFPSNWHLSIARATNTAYHLMNNLGLDQARVSVVGNSEFKPIADNVSPEGRSLNRRVDIVILNK